MRAKKQIKLLHRLNLLVLNNPNKLKVTPYIYDGGASVEYVITEVGRDNLLYSIHFTPKSLEDLNSKIEVECWKSGEGYDNTITLTELFECLNTIVEN